MISFDQLLSIARNASQKILSIYSSKNIHVTSKFDDSPLTNADIASNEAIMKGLKEFSDFPIVSEESIIEYDNRKEWKKYWLVDPLDGTKDFIAKNNQFTINIALINKNEPVLGLLYLRIFFEH